MLRRLHYLPIILGVCAAVVMTGAVILALVILMSQMPHPSLQERVELHSTLGTLTTVGSVALVCLVLCLFAEDFRTSVLDLLG
jgi:hypothetical protein